jgi:hypothetical protein
MGELYMRTIRLPDFLRELPPPLGYQGIRIEESKLNKIIFCLNIRDHHGRVYYPEVMWTIFHSIAGMNDDKVLNCEQITNILKLVKNKYKGLGKKVNLDSLCGNKYYRKELTAIKYIQAMKILYKWRNFKNVEQKRREQMTCRTAARQLMCLQLAILPIQTMMLDMMTLTGARSRDHKPTTNTSSETMSLT